MTDSLKLFEMRARVIYHYACRYGVEHTPYEVNGEWSPEAFVRTCHAGFAMAQHLIVDELITLHQRQRELTTQLGIVRRERDKASQNKIKQLLGTEKFKEQVIRKLADSIAWQLLRNQNYIARRLYIGEDSPPSIDKSNLASVVKVINELNAKDPLSFALISDTTSFIQVGDVLRIHHNGIEIIEVKEGEKNLQAITILESLEESSEIEEKKLAGEHGQDLAKQITRMSRQQKRAQRAVNVLNTGSGPDTSTGIPIQVKDVEFPESKYLSDLKNLFEELNDKYTDPQKLDHKLRWI